MAKRFVEPTWLAQVARDSGLIGAEDLASTLAHRGAELVELSTADHEGLRPIYEVRFSRAIRGEGALVDGFDGFMERLRGPGASELFGLSGSDCNFVGLITRDKLIALCVIHEPTQ
jgi:hypothetical protein